MSEKRVPEGIEGLLENNRAWARQVTEEDPEFFRRLSRQQNPEYLWIGCADSRVPANEIVHLLPGELFVHRNVANLVVHTDMNCMAVLQFAIEVLRVKHVIVCGHYGCGGVKAAMEHEQFGLIDNWLRHIKDIYLHNLEVLESVADPGERIDRLCELNVISQVFNVCSSTICQNAWARNQPLAVHGWIYGLEDGLVKDLSVVVDRPEQIPAIYRMPMTRQADNT